MKKVLGYADLKSKGIPFCRQHIHKLVRQKKFPAPFKIGDRTNVWHEDVIDQYFEQKMEAAQTGKPAAP